MDALRELIVSGVLYAIPLFCGRRCLGVGFFLWPFAFLFLVLGVIDALVAVQ